MFGAATTTAGPGPAEGGSPRRVLVIADDPASAHPALTLDFDEAVVVTPALGEPLPVDPRSSFDAAVVADFDGGPAGLSSRLNLARHSVRGDGAVAVALTADVGGAGTSSPATEWTTALATFTWAGLSEDGTLVWLRAADAADRATGPLLAGAFVATRHAAAAATREAARLSASAALETRAAADGEPDQTDELVAELAVLRRRVRRLERSRALRLARRVGALRAAGPVGALRTVRTREVVAVLAGAVLVVLTLAVLVAVLRAATGSVASALAITVLVLAVAGLACLNEIERRRTRRALAAVDKKVGAMSRRNSASLRALTERTRLDSVELHQLADRTRNMGAAAHDTAVSAARIEQDLKAAHPDRVGRLVARETTKQYEQLQAAMNLFGLVDVEAPVPPLRGWAVSPDALLVLVTELLAARPAIVLECGSGSSTLWTALVIKRFGLATRIVSLEHEAAYKRATEELLARHGVAHLAEVRHAPLVPTGIPEHDTAWYDANAVADLRDVGLLFIDGPPEATGPLARYPALPLLLPHLADDAVVVLDDAVRPAEKAAVERWAAENPGLSATYLTTEKGTSVLRYSRRGPAA